MLNKTMRNLIIAALLLPGAAFAAPNTTTVPSTLFTQPLPSKLTTLTPTTAGAGFNLPPGVAPTSPVDGDCWTTTLGLYCRINGSTVGPIGPGGLTINGTPVSGASAGQVLYSDGTKLQAYPVTGTGPAVLSNSPTFSGTVAGNATIPLSILVQIPANTMLGNWSSGTAYNLANTIPPCPDTGGQHLNYVSGSGMRCGTSSNVAWFNVTDYASMAAAQTACGAAGGGLVYIPGGTTASITATVTPPTNCGITGDGPSSVLQQLTASAPAVTAANPGTTLSNFKIAYASQGTSGGIGIYNTCTNGDGCLRANSVTIANAYIGVDNYHSQVANYDALYIIDSTIVGYQCDTCVNSILTNSWIIGDSPGGSSSYMTSGGIYFYGAAVGNIVASTQVYGTNGPNVWLTDDGTPTAAHAPFSNVFVGNFFDLSHSIGGINTGFSNLFNQNWISGEGFEVGASAGDSNTFNGNTFTNASLDGLLIKASALNTVVNGNVFMRNNQAAGGYGGIKVESGAAYFTIVGNSFTNASTGGGGGTMAYSVDLATSTTTDHFLVTNNLVGSVGAVSNNVTVTTNWAVTQNY